MERDITICFQTSSEIKSALDKIAEEEGKSVSLVVESIIHYYLDLKKNKAVEGSVYNRRRFERKKVSIPAYIGDSRWQRYDFESGTILDISVGGIQISVPKGTTVGIKNICESDNLSIIFHIPDYHWPINVKICPKRVCETAEDVQIGASLMNPDFQAYSALQKYLI
jgi:hypothetical protein